MDLFALRGLCRAVGVAILVALLTMSQAHAAPPLCSDGRSSLQDIAQSAAQLEISKRLGKMWNRLVRLPGGADAVFYIVFEKSAAASVYVFHKGCMVAASDGLPADKVLTEIGNTDRAAAFGDKGI